MEENYTLFYSANGGSYAPPAQQGDASSNEVIITTSIAQKENYGFVGWSTNPEATNADANYAAGNTITLTENLTLYAVYKRIAFQTLYAERVDDEGNINEMGTSVKVTYWIQFDESLPTSGVLGWLPHVPTELEPSGSINIEDTSQWLGSFIIPNYSFESDTDNEQIEFYLQNSGGLYSSINKVITIYPLASRRFLYRKNNTWKNFMNIIHPLGQIYECAGKAPATTFGGVWEDCGYLFMNMQGFPIIDDNNTYEGFVPQSSDNIRIWIREK